MDPEASFHLDAVDADPFPIPRQSDAMLRYPVCKTSNGSILILYASFVSIHDPPLLQFEPPQLLNFDLDAKPDPNPAFDFDADPDPAFTMIQIQIRNII